MGDQEIKIRDVLLKELMIIDAEPFKDKEELFLYISEKFEETGIVSDKVAFKQSLDSRESLGPTYMGEFIAIPHGKCKEVIKPGVGFIRCKDSFIYRSGEEEGPVKYIFVLAIIDNQVDNSHLRILATLSGYLVREEFVELIANVQSYEELLNGIDQLEK